MQNPYTDPSLMESDADKSFSQSTLMQTSQRLTGQNDAAIEQREREINDIAKGIIELSDIFRELQSMVIDQGTMLDRIDYNIERMGTEVKAADKELKVVRLRPVQPPEVKFPLTNLHIVGYELPTTYSEAQDHAPAGDHSRRPVYRSTGQAEEAQFPGSRSRPGAATSPAN